MRTRKDVSTMLAARYATKKDLKAAIGHELRYSETSLMGNEFKPDGTFPVVGPSPTSRKWYANVTMQNGLIKSVK